jgi:hypothetical protein
MSKLSALIGKAKTFEIGGISLDIKPLSIEDMDLFSLNESASKEEQVAVSKKLITKVLKESVPDATDDEIKQIGVNYMAELMNAIMEVNGMNDQKNPAMKKIHDAIKR